MNIPTNIYRKIIEYIAVPTVDFIFLNQNKEILLWLRNNAPLKWVYYLPWWRIQKWETIIEAAKRKAKEEININIDQDRLKFIGVYDDIFKDSIFNDLSAHYLPCTFLYYISEDEQKEIQPDNQHDNIKFFSYNEINLHPFLKTRLQNIQASYNIF